MKLTHIKFLHNSFPPFFESSPIPVKRRYDFYFTEENRYALRGEDQYDFNKLCGLKCRYRTPKFDTVMVGWRWNPSLNCFEVIPYFHIGGPAHIFDEAKIIRLQPNEKGWCEIEIAENMEVSMRIGNALTGQESIDTKVFSENYGVVYEVCAWFGGQKACPKFRLILNIDRSNF